MLGVALLAQLAITASGPDTASACLPIQLSMALRTPGSVAPRIEPPNGAGLQLLRSSVVSRLEQDAIGRFTTITEASAQVATGRIGRVQIPPFVAMVDGRRLVSKSFDVDVRFPVAPPPVVIVRARLDHGAGRAAAESLTVGQQVDYAVDVLMNERARSRLRRNPTFFPPEMASVLAYDVEVPTTIPRQGRRCFETLSYRRALFPLFPGRVAIPPAVLTYSLPLSASFFSREESFEARTDSVRFTAVDPPARDRPSDFAGAVGTLRVSSRVATQSARMGDPVVLTVRVSAVGNVKLLPRPVLSLPWATHAVGDERVQIDSTSNRISGSKEFDWIITPRVAGRQVIPAIRYPYYDPVINRYAVIETSPLMLSVSVGALASSDTAIGPRIPLHLVMRPERSPPLSTHPLYWVLFALAPLPATVRRLARRRWSSASELTAAKRLRGAASARASTPPRELRRLFLDALRERVPAVGRDREPLARVLRRAGVSDDAALEAESLLARLDDAAFSPVGEMESGAEREAVEIVEMVDREAVHLTKPRSMGFGVSALFLLMATVLSAAPNDAAQSFAEGVRAYDRGQFAVAERRFARATEAAPNAIDAWANLAAAAWENADTAQASRGWHRVMRLDPLDAESRARLGSIQALGPSSPAYVAPVPIDALAGLILAAWMVAWLTLAVPRARRPALARPLAGGAIALALAGVAALFELESRRDARGLGVLVRGGSLFETPAMDGAPLAAVGAGEAGRIGARDDGWVHLTLDGTRAGWAPAASVLPIDAVQSSRLTGLAPVR